MNDLAKIEEVVTVAKDFKPTREDIINLQTALATMEQSHDLVTNDYFANGMYCREVHRPKGTLIVGKVHKKEHFFMVIKGQINVWTEEGMLEMKAPYIQVSKPGTKRVTWAAEDSTGVTVHRTDFTDLKDIEKENIEEDTQAKFDMKNVLKQITINDLVKKAG
jgi:quercetin dioxygenase-like cupin family protein